MAQVTIALVALTAVVLGGTLWQLVVIGRWWADPLGRLLVGALFAAFGIIHSVRPDGGLSLPWALEGQALVLSAQFVAAYAVLAALLWLLSWQRPAGAPVARAQ